jgi:iron only hydrogenase large subunit-like protein
LVLLLQLVVVLAVLVIAVKMADQVVAQVEAHIALDLERQDKVLMAVQVKKIHTTLQVEVEAQVALGVAQLMHLFNNQEVVAQGMHPLFLGHFNFMPQVLVVLQVQLLVHKRD